MRCVPGSICVRTIKYVGTFLEDPVREDSVPMDLGLADVQPWLAIKQDVLNHVSILLRWNSLPIFRVLHALEGAHCSWRARARV